VKSRIAANSLSYRVKRTGGGRRVADVVAVGPVARAASCPADGSKAEGQRRHGERTTDDTCRRDERHQSGAKRTT
jgi:hypothetical protein